MHCVIFFYDHLVMSLPSYTELPEQQQNIAASLPNMMNIIPFPIYFSDFSYVFFTAVCLISYLKHFFVDKKLPWESFLLQMLRLRQQKQILNILLMLGR